MIGRRELEMENGKGISKGKAKPGAYAFVTARRESLVDSQSPIPHSPVQRATP